MGSTLALLLLPPPLLLLSSPSIPLPPPPPLCCLLPPLRAPPPPPSFFPPDMMGVFLGGVLLMNPCGWSGNGFVLSSSGISSWASSKGSLPPWQKPSSLQYGTLDAQSAEVLHWPERPSPGAAAPWLGPSLP